MNEAESIHYYGHPFLSNSNMKCFIGLNLNVMPWIDQVPEKFRAQAIEACKRSRASVQYLTRNDDTKVGFIFSVQMNFADIVAREQD